VTPGERQAFDDMRRSQLKNKVWYPYAAAADLIYRDCLMPWLEARRGAASPAAAETGPPAPAPEKAVDDGGEG